MIRRRRKTARAGGTLRRGNIPQAMEDKWFWYMEGSTLWAHRSWTGYCIYRIDMKEDGRHAVTVNRDPEQYGCTSIEEDAATLNKLLDRSPITPIRRGFRRHMTRWKKRAGTDASGYDDLLFYPSAQPFSTLYTMTVSSYGGGEDARCIRKE